MAFPPSGGQLEGVSLVCSCAASVLVLGLTVKHRGVMLYIALPGERGGLAAHGGAQLLSSPLSGSPVFLSLCSLSSSVLSYPCLLSMALTPLVSLTLGLS